MRKAALFWLGLVVALLATLGLVVLSSAGGVNAARIHHNQYHFLTRQFAFCALGVVLAFVAAKFDYRNWRKYPVLTIAFYAIMCALLVAVLFTRPINGSSRWIKLPFFNLQPSELAKLAAVICTAVYLDRLAWRVELFWKGGVGAAAIFGVLAALVMKEPDFGSTMVIAAAGFLVMFLAGVRLRQLFLFGLLGVAVVGWHVAHNSNRMARISAFIATSSEQSGQKTEEQMDPAAKRAEYQSRQSLVAIKNGGIAGVGLGQSMQKQAYLPEAHTDFIFAIGAEEMGLLYSVGVLTLFTAFFLISMYIAEHAPDRFGRYLVCGMAFIIFFQAMFNLGVVCRALPTKGMALPFFSYGGTNMLSAFFAVGTIFSVGLRAVKEQH